MNRQRAVNDVVTYIVPGPFSFHMYQLRRLRVAMGKIREASLEYWQKEYDKDHDLEVLSTSPNSVLQPHISIAYQGDYVFPEERSGSIEKGTLHSVYTIQLIDLQPYAKQRVEEFLEYLKSIPPTHTEPGPSPTYLWTKEDEALPLVTIEDDSLDEQPLQFDSRRSL